MIDYVPNGFVRKTNGVSVIVNHHHLLHLHLHVLLEVLLLLPNVRVMITKRERVVHEI